MSQVLLLGPPGPRRDQVRASLDPEVPIVVDDLRSARERLDDVDVVLAWLHLGDDLATDLVGGPGAHPQFALVTLVEEGDEREAVEVIKAGALDYVVLSARSIAALPHILRGVRREMEQRERARIAEDRLRHANRLIGTGRLAAVTAHEVGTPLNVARIQAQLVAARPEVDADVIDRCEKIIEQIDIVSSRLRGMLDYARVGTLGRDPVSLVEAVRSAVTLVEPLAIRQGVQLTFEGDQLLALCSRSQVQQVVFNLLSNAMHGLASKGGRIDVRLRPETRAGQRYAVVTVSDDGPGIPNSVQPRVFDAFFTTKPAGRGTGLGLSVCRDIAADHGGFLEFESRPGGTTFRFGLPT